MSDLDRTQAEDDVFVAWAAEVPEAIRRPSNAQRGKGLAFR